MPNILVNAMGDTCPIPVVKTKNAIKEMTESGQVEIHVDNEIAVQNLTKMANVKGYPVHAEKKAESEYHVFMEIQKDQDEAAVQTKDLPEETVCVPDSVKKKKIIVISSDQMGNGSEELGRTLLKAFLYAVTQQDELPETILFYNGGVHLTCEESPALEDLKSLEAQGVEIMSCGTCLNYYGLTEQLKVGTVTNMYVIVEKMEQADLIVKPC